MNNSAGKQELWVGDASFQARLKELLCDPVEHGLRFHADLLPVRRTIAVYGHREAHKAEVVAEFCERNLLSYAVVSARYGFTQDIAKDVQAAFTRAGSEGIMVLILDHADVLALEPANEETQRFGLQLEDLAQQQLCMVVACFDRVLREYTETYVRHFRAPFVNAAVYLAPPHSTWIAAWLRTQFETYIKYAPQGSGLSLGLTDDEWTVLAQHCVGASWGHLREWVQKALHEAFRQRGPDGTLVIDREFLTRAPLMYGGNRGLHIVAVDVRRDESNFSTAVGQGPTLVEPAESLVKPPPTFMEELDKKVKKRRGNKKRAKFEDAETEGGDGEEGLLLKRRTRDEDDDHDHDVDEAKQPALTTEPEN